MIAFFDASALIYLIEAAESFAARVRKELAAVGEKHPERGAAMSRLSWAECRVGPMKKEPRTPVSGIPTSSRANATMASSYFSGITATCSTNVMAAKVR